MALRNVRRILCGIEIIPIYRFFAFAVFNAFNVFTAFTILPFFDSLPLTDRLIFENSEKYQNRIQNMIQNGKTAGPRGFEPPTT